MSGGFRGSFALDPFFGRVEGLLRGQAGQSIYICVNNLIGDYLQYRHRLWISLYCDMARLLSFPGF